MDAQLLVSLSGISPRTLYRSADLAAELDRRKVPLSLLYAPRTGDRAVTEWVRGRAGRGDAVLLHGYDHQVTPTHRTVRIGKKAEFASLPAHEARLRLIAAKALMDNAGLRADGFAPPRWLASRGTLEALREHGFSLCADLATVRDLRTGDVHRARVQEFGRHRQRTETVRCFALVVGAARAARRGGLIRLGAVAADLARPGLLRALLDAVDVALENRAFGSTYVAIGESALKVSPVRPVAAP